MDNIHWLSQEDIEDRSGSPESMLGMQEMVGSGQCVGGMVNSVLATVKQVCR